MDILIEDRRSVEQVVQFLDDYITSKKSHPLYGVYLKDVLDFKKRVVYPWLDEIFIYEKDYNEKQEALIKNNVLDFYNVLRRLFEDGT